MRLAKLSKVSNRVTATPSGVVREQVLRVDSTGVFLFRGKPEMLPSVWVGRLINLKTRLDTGEQIDYAVV